MGAGRKAHSLRVARGLRALAWLAALSLAGCGEREAPKTPLNLVLITIDTLRADHLFCYGYAL